MKTILVVDDEADIADTLQLFLELRGFRVIVAYDGREAFDKVVAERPDLVVTDLMMPRMSGGDLIHRMRQTPGVDGTPVITMSASGVSGHQPFLRKPFPLTELLSEIDRVLDRKAEGA